MIALDRGAYFRHFATVLGGNGAAQAVNLLGYFFLARLYTPHEFGAFGLFVAVSAIPAALASARLEYAMPTAPRESASSVLWLAISASVGVGLLSCAIAALVWRELLQAVLLGACVTLTGGCSSYSAFLLRHDRYRAVSAAVVLRTAAAILAQCALALVSAKAVSLVLGYTFGLAAQALMFTALAIWRVSPDRPRWAGMKAMATRYRRQIAVDVPNALAASVYFNLLTFVLAALYDQKTVGYYTMGNRLAVVPFTLFNDALGQVFFQKAARAKEAKGHLWEELKLGLLTTSVISAAVLFGILLFARPLIVSFLGASWRTAADMLMVLAPMIAVRGAVLTISPIAFILKRPGWLLAYSVIAIALMGVAVVATVVLRLGPLAFLGVASGLWAIEAAVLGGALVYAAHQDRVAQTRAID